MTEHVIKAVGENESRELHVARTEEGVEIKIWWGRGNKYLATLNFIETETRKLINDLTELLAD